MIKDRDKYKDTVVSDKTEHGLILNVHLIIQIIW